MKTKRYSLLVVFGLLAFLLLSADSFAQRGRYHNGRGYRGYSRHYYPSYRSYAYNRPFISLNFGGSRYRYQQGYFYRPYGSVLRVSVPPFGIRIATLPPGYRRVYAGPDPYYYYNGVYYRDMANQYEVVAPPLGATVSALPHGAKVTVIDGQKYYEFQGTYYQEDIVDGSELVYTVVGTDGVLNTSDGSTAITDPPAGPQIGDRFDNLPTDAKAVVINGEKVYASNSGLYYKEVIEGNKVYYEVVGK